MVANVVVRRSGVAAWDVAMWFVALALVMVARFEFSVSVERWWQHVAYILVAAGLQLVLGFSMHLYLGRSRLGSFSEAVQLAAITAVAGGLAAGISVLMNAEFSRAVALLVPCIAFLAMMAGRVLVRTVADGQRRRPAPEAARAIVYGAGDVGTQLARLIDTTPKRPYTLVGFLDDDSSKHFLRVRRYRMLGTGADLERVAAEVKADALILAISSASAELIASLDARCKAIGVALVVVPPVREMLNGRVELDKLRTFNVADLLGRRQIRTDLGAIVGYVKGRVVLVTGAGGSIGSELARQLAQMEPTTLLLLDRDESALHAVQLSLYGNGLLDSDDMVLCDIRDAEALSAVFRKHKPQVVFHAAALKHLPMLEQYPDEGWKTNVLGSLNVLACARDVSVERFVNISTDKAADATAVLGQTKRLAERLTAHFAAETGRPYLSVRFGNVLGSRGSVLFAFRAQIERGGPVTVTHPDVTRYFMTIPEACELVLQAGAIGSPGDALVLDMGTPVKIVDVAKRLIEESGRTDIEIVYTGLRHGEKLHEVLFSSGEGHLTSTHPLIS